MRWAWVILIILGAEAMASGQDKVANPDERLLLQKKIKIDEAGLLQFFRERTLNKAQIAEVTAKVKQLAAGAYKDRQQAMAELVRFGSQARPILLDVVKERREPLETIRRVELCLRTFPEDPEAALAGAAARLLGGRKTPEATEVLWNYLPFAANPEVVEEIQKTLASLARENNRAQEALIKGITDAHPRKRGVAGAVLIQNGALTQVPALDQLLKDKDPQVRFQVARALLQVKNKAAIPVLIDLIAALPQEEVWQVEEMLARIAGSKGPKVFVDPDHKPAKVREAWNGWWRNQQNSIDLAKIDPPTSLMGRTLVTQMDAKGTTGRVFELLANKEIAWQIDGLRYPLDAQVIGKDRVLIAEYFNRRVSERDFKGKILWEKQVDMPIGCQRLPNGQTFIATRRQLLIVEPDGKEVFTYFHQNTSISAARRLKNGHMVLVTSGGMLDRLDAKGRVLKSFQVGSIYPMGGNIDVLANGHVLVPQYRDGRVVEYDAEGKNVRQIAVPLPTSVVQMPNGNILVVSMARRQVLELTREGREVWSYKTDGRPWRAWKR